ncbi:hypothetical protein [Chlorogloeopsis sp. ULAP02]|uniref:hypothetical protein n=1 Tax=Chlorogloeopsis sp. ULAP02 TaxID=3107926 RepID=UPI003136B680
MNEENIQQLKDEINQEVRECLKKVDLAKLLEKYGIPEDQFIKIQCSIDLHPIRFNSTAKELQPMGLLNEIPKPDIKLGKLAWCYPCPAPGYPNGCHCF